MLIIGILLALVSAYEFRTDLTPADYTVVTKAHIDTTIDTVTVYEGLDYGIPFNIFGACYNVTDADSVILKGLKWVADTTYDTLVFASTDTVQSLYEWAEILEVIVRGASVADSDSVFLWANASRIDLGTELNPFDTIWVNEIDMGYADYPFTVGWGLDWSDAEDSAWVDTTDLKDYFYTELETKGVIHDTADVVRGEIRDTATVVWNDSLSIIKGLISDTADVVRSEIRDTSALIVHDTADVVRGEIRDTATVVWNDSLSVIKGLISDTADVVRGEIRDTATAVWVDSASVMRTYAQTTAGDTANVVRGEMRDTATIVWNDSVSIIRTYTQTIAGDTAGILRAEMGDTAEAHLDTLISYLLKADTNYTDSSDVAGWNYVNSWDTLGIYLLKADTNYTDSSDVDGWGFMDDTDVDSIKIVGDYLYLYEDGLRDSADISTAGADTDVDSIVWSNQRIYIYEDEAKDSTAIIKPDSASYAYDFPFAVGWGLDWSDAEDSVWVDTTDLKNYFYTEVETREIIHDTADVVRGEIRDTSTAVWNDSLSVIKGLIGDTADIVRDEIRDTATVVWNDSLSVIKGLIGDTVDVARGEIRDTAIVVSQTKWNYRYADTSQYSLNADSLDGKASSYYIDTTGGQTIGGDLTIEGNTQLGDTADITIIPKGSKILFIDATGTDTVGIYNSPGYFIIGIDKHPLAFGYLDDWDYYFQNYFTMEAPDTLDFGIWFNIGDTTGWHIYVPGAAHGTDDLIFYDSDEDRIIFKKGGYVGILTMYPPEALSVVGNIATGDTTAGDIDVYHYFSTNGSWTDEYLKWDDGDSEFQLSADLDLGGHSVTRADTCDYSTMWVDSISAIKSLIGDTADVVRGEIRDTATAVWNDSLSVVKSLIGDTADIIRGEIRDTSALVAHDTVDVVRGEIRDTATVVWNDSLSVVKGLIGDTANVVRSEIRDTSSLLNAGLTSDSTWSGITASVTVDSNEVGWRAALYLASDGHYEEADADTIVQMPCLALALEAGTGTKKVLLQGFVCDTAWDWTLGAGTANLIYVSTTTGTLTQTAPSATGDQVQIVGYAVSADALYFNPNLMLIEIQ